MQVITAVYLNCRPDLRDEWLTGIEVDDAVDSQVGVGDDGSTNSTNSSVRLKSKRCDTW